MERIGPKRINPLKGKSIEIEKNEEGCFVCTSHTPTSDGYIRVFVSKSASPRMQLLHRIEWEKVNGLVPEGYELDHLCRNRNCCNVAHLQLLSVSAHKTKTNLERYAERTKGIVCAIQSGESSKEIAKRYGVTVNTVNRIKRSTKEK